MKIYDLVKKLLAEYPDLRSSDKRLIWKVWEVQGIAKGYITKQDFLEKAELPESIRRARQEIQRNIPELDGKSNWKKESMKGAFVFHERVMVFNDKDNTVSFI